MLSTIARVFRAAYLDLVIGWSARTRAMETTPASGRR